MDHHFDHWMHHIPSEPNISKESKQITPKQSPIQFLKNHKIKANYRLTITNPFFLNRRIQANYHQTITYPFKKIKKRHFDHQSVLIQRIIFCLFCSCRWFWDPSSTNLHNSVAGRITVRVRFMKISFNQWFQSGGMPVTPRPSEENRPIGQDLPTQR